MFGTVGIPDKLSENVSNRKEESDMASWWCTPEEAEDEYYNQRSICNSARNSYESARSQRNAVENQWGSCSNSIDSCRAQKLDFERRLHELQEIVALMERTSGDNCPNGAADRANNTARTANGLYSDSVRCSGVPNNDIAQAFRTQSVTENAFSGRALELLRAEAQRLEEAIRRLNEQIRRLEEEAERLRRQAEELSNQMQGCLARIDECTYSMHHFAGIAWS